MTRWYVGGKLLRAHAYFGNRRTSLCGKARRWLQAEAAPGELRCFDCQKRARMIVAVAATHSKPSRLCTVATSRNG